MLNVIETSPNIQFIMPFILKNIEENYEAIIYNGALKKNLYVMVIDALFNNELIKMDFHVNFFDQKHIIIKILITFVTSNTVSLSTNSDELILRQNAAKMLAKIVARYSMIISNNDTYYPKLKHNILTLLTRELLTQLRYAATKDNYSVVFGIFKFFSFMDSKAINSYLFDAILQFAAQIDQGKVEIEKPEGKLTSGSLFSASVMLEPFLVM